ncbi:MAG: hypothetical protein AAF649_10610 [Verrucomicrobiota bacterium]
MRSWIINRLVHDRELRKILWSVLLVGSFIGLVSDVHSQKMDANRYAEVYQQYLASASPLQADDIRHFVFISRDELRNHLWLKCERLSGAQILYPWRTLEKSRGVYDFSKIHDDLDYLENHGKQLFIQLQDTTFNPQQPAVPDYLRTPEFNGGDFAKQNENGIPSGWVAQRWNPKVRDRFALLLEALGKEFDGRIEGINLPETAVEGLDHHQDPSFSPELYAQAIQANMAAMKQAFPRSVTVQYANFMPGEWLPWNDRGYLRSIFAYGQEIGVGLGGPDLMVRRKAQLNHALALMHENTFTVPLAIAVQRGNYIGMTGADLDPGRQMPQDSSPGSSQVPMLHAFAKDFLKVRYLFWQNEEPYFTRDVLPMLR